ncbi:MAG: hypothetical protein WDZ37_02250 [Solirubrobacterales bacterium]
MLVTFDLDSYSQQAERFAIEMDREYYLHFSGRKEGYEIEAIYDRHAELFERDSVETLRGLVGGAQGDAERRLRRLLELAIEGLIGRATKSQAAALAEREATLEIELDGRVEPFRQAALLQANEPAPEARAKIEATRLAVQERELNPLMVEIAQRTQELVRGLGWPSYLAMHEQLKGFGIAALERETSAFSDVVEARYREVVEPALRDQLGLGLAELRRSDMARFFRAPGFDELFARERLTEALERTLAGLGIDLHAQPNVTLDLEPRPHKSPRAFCSPVRVPQEIHLVMPTQGGREDYATLLHEAGHTEHYAHASPEMPFEFRHLGDNSVTESFAFLFEHLTENPAWLRAVLGVETPDDYARFARAAKIVFLRRYAAKLSYELALHGGERPLSEMPALYSETLGRAIEVEWPRVTYLSDVDNAFYAANYLRAWALETHWRRLLVERFGERWFDSADAGAFLRGLWAQGQRLRADELLAEVTGERLDFGVMAAEVAEAATCHCSQ